MLFARLGGAIGPLVVGALVARHVPLRNLFQLATVPLIVGTVASIAVTVIYQAYYQKKPATEPVIPMAAGSRGLDGASRMGMTLAEKILATKSGATHVSPGQIVDAYPDLVMSHTATWRSVSVMKKIGATKLYDPERLAIVLDHISPAKTEKYAADQQTSRNFAREYGIEKFYDVDAGIAHLVLMEHGHVKPGDLIVGTDSHCTIYGALGALGIGHRLHRGHIRVGHRQAVDEGAEDHQDTCSTAASVRASARRT